MPSLTPEIKYAVGIDFGHGECSAAFCEIGWGKSNTLLESPTDIRLHGNERFTIPSAYSVSAAGKMLVGHSAISSIRDASKFKISFKKRPSEMDDSEQGLYSEYLGHVHRLIISKSGKLATGNYVVYLSCPSGWSIDDRILFRQMAVSRGIPVAGIWAESRAGLFSNMENQSEITRELMREGCILADIGSSTIDFSYLNGTLKTPIMDYGIQDGAQILDMMLYYYILSLSGNEKAKQLVQEEGLEWLKDVLVYTCRTAKEGFFSSETECSLSCNYDFREIFLDEDKEKASARFRCNKEHGGTPEEIMKLFIGGLSSVGLSATPDEHFAGVDWDAVNKGYFSVFATRLNNFVKHHVKNNPVKIILLSGGASYMFLSEKGQELFRNSILAPTFPGSHIEIGFDGQPSTSVSRGICSLGRAYARYLGCEDADHGEAYESLQTKIEKTLDYHTSVLGLIGTQQEEDKNRITAIVSRIRERFSPTETVAEPLSKKVPFGEAAKYFIHALGRTESAYYDKETLEKLIVLMKTVAPEQPMPATISKSLGDDYEAFLSGVIAGSTTAKQIVSKAIVDTIMPITKEYIHSFKGETLQELRDGLAKVIEENYPKVSQVAFSSAKDLIKSNLEIERTYVSDLISLYTASLQKDFMLDNETLSEAIHLPSVNELLGEVDVYEAVDVIATIILSLMMMVVNVVVCSILLGIPWIVSYFTFAIKEKNWSLDDWSDWHVDKFMHIDFPRVKLYSIGRKTIRDMYDLTYDSNEQRTKRNILKTLEKKEFDKSIVEAFISAANVSKKKYLEVVNNIFN